MTETTPEPSLADRIAAARDRSTALASRTRDFVQAHPVASLAGGIAMGALLAGVLTRRKASTATERGNARMMRLAAIGAELALNYAARAANASRDGMGKIEDQLGHLSDNSVEAGRKLTGIAQIALTTLREASEAALHRLSHRE